MKKKDKIQKKEIRQNSKVGTTGKIDEIRIH
jgi:hypothetical protein